MVKTEANAESDGADSGAEEDVAMETDDGTTSAALARERRALKELEAGAKVKIVHDRDFFYVTGVRGGQVKQSALLVQNSHESRRKYWAIC